jgi:hypothetical protein
MALAVLESANMEKLATKSTSDVSICSGGDQPSLVERTAAPEPRSKDRKKAPRYDAV